MLLRGNVIVEGGEVVAKPGIGQFVRRARFGEQLTAAGCGGEPGSGRTPRPTAHRSTTLRPGPQSPRGFQRVEHTAQVRLPDPGVHGSDAGMPYRLSALISSKGWPNSDGLPAGVHADWKTRYSSATSFIEPSFRRS